LKQLGLYWSFSDLICYIQILIIVLAGTIMAHRGELSVGNLFVFISYESMILWPIRNLGRILADLGKLSVSIERLLEILDVPVESTDGKKTQIEGKIEFKDVCFGYENQPNVLNHVSFTIEKGQTVAILGPTGSGKSSMIHLISRLYDPISGEVLIDGVPTIELEKKNLRKQIGLVLQEPFLFSKTIEENIRIARKNASKEELHHAAKIASVHDVIEEFDAGYQTMIGEKGVTLSGGQKQRVAIARTIVNQTPILIFDDSLSAVDAQTDADIREALKSVSDLCTTLIITQRINSAKDADLILVLEHGQITQSGTHESLMSVDGLYKRVAEIQARGEE
jgi:ATP-binding cassette subfamily B protein